MALLDYMFVYLLAVLALESYIGHSHIVSSGTTERFSTARSLDSNDSGNETRSENSLIIYITRFTFNYSFFPDGVHRGNTATPSSPTRHIFLKAWSPSPVLLSNQLLKVGISVRKLCWYTRGRIILDRIIPGRNDVQITRCEGFCPRFR